MAKKLTATEIKKIAAAKNVVLGTSTTVRNLKLGKISKVVLSSNCPESVIRDIEHYAELGKAEVIKSPYPNEELGIICKKPFSVSVISVLKGAE